MKYRITVKFNIETKDYHLSRPTLEDAKCLVKDMLHGLADMPNRGVQISAAPDVVKDRPAASKDPYWIEEDDRHACQTCTRGCAYDVVTPDGSALGISFTDEDEALNWVGNLNAAYDHGYSAGLRSKSKAKRRSKK